MKKELERKLHKSSAVEFIFELLYEYELSQKESESILETAKQCFKKES